MTRRQQYIAKYGTRFLSSYDLAYFHYRRLCRAARLARSLS